MAQRQFRSDDTSIWTTRYGSGASGDKTYTVTHTLDSGDSYYNGTFTGTASATTGSTGISDATYNLPCIIHQTQKTGVGSWELNFLTTVSGGTATFSNPLINTYTTGAQIVTAAPYATITVNGSITVSPPDWNGGTGGIVFLIASNSITVTGTISAKGTQNNSGLAGGGFRGGGGNNLQRLGTQGEGTTGNSGTLTTANQGNGGGGGTFTGGGSGGGNANTGTATSGSNAGTAAGSADLTTMVFGGGGGAGGYNGGQNGNGGSAGNGGGIIFLISPTITVTGALTVDGKVGGNAGSSDGTAGGGGGGGAGGSILLKGQVLSLGTNLLSAAAGGGGSHVNGGSNGGAGSVGRFHVDYSNTLSGTASPTIDTRQDASLATTGGSFLFHII